MEPLKLQEIFDELQKDITSPELVQDNKQIFIHKEDVYRIAMPNQKALSDANKLRNQIFVKLLREKDEDGKLKNVVLKTLIEDLKLSNIDIEAMQAEADKLEEELVQVYLSLAKKKDSEQTQIEKLKIQLEDIKQERLKIIIEKAGYLAPAIENQAQEEYYRCLTAVCTEKYSEEKVKEETIEKWSKVWTSFEEYQKEESTLHYIALGNLTELLLNM